LPQPNDGGGWNFADFSGISRIHLSLCVIGQIAPWGVMLSAFCSGGGVRKLVGITDEKLPQGSPLPSKSVFASLIPIEQWSLKGRLPIKSALLRHKRGGVRH
jgi:hypothetical protein